MKKVLTCFLVLVLGALTFSTEANSTGSNVNAEAFAKARNEVQRGYAIKAGLLNYFSRNADVWPADWEELKTFYSPGQPTSVFGTQWTFAKVDNSIVLSLDATEVRFARYMSQLMLATYSGTTVNIPVDPPVSMAVNEVYLSRKADPTRPNNNQMEQDLLLGDGTTNYSITNVQDITGSGVLTINQITASDVALNSLSITANAGDNATDKMRAETVAAAVDGSVTVTGDVSSGSVTVTGEVSSGSGTFGTVVIGVADDNKETSEKNTLTVNGIVDLNHTVNIAKVNVAGDSTINGALTVGTAKKNADTMLNGSLTVGTASAPANTVLNGTLAAGATTVESVNIGEVASIDSDGNANVKTLSATAASVESLNVNSKAVIDSAGAGAFTSITSTGAITSDDSLNAPQVTTSSLVLSQSDAITKTLSAVDGGLQVSDGADSFTLTVGEDAGTKYLTIATTASEIKTDKPINASLKGDVTGNLTGDVTGNLKGDVTGNLKGDVTGNLKGNVTGNLTGDVTGNADTATKLKSAVDIKLTGAVTGTLSFDGSNAVEMATSVNHNHNDLYFTEVEINNKLSVLETNIKADIKVSETNAANSAVAAATSETNAANSATAAKADADRAADVVALKKAEWKTEFVNAAAAATKASEENAATSATNAATSATNAATSATNAANSATASANSATAAKTDADRAADVVALKKAEWKTEFVNAAALATKTSEENAATSATNAANSATAAATSAGEAKTHADNASAAAKTAVDNALVDYVTTVDANKNYAAINHNHDGTYAKVDDVYTKATANTTFALKDHNHDSVYAVTNHNHDTRYFTESEITGNYYSKTDSDGRFAANTHNHDSRYFTESEVNDKLSGYYSKASGVVIGANKITLVSPSSTHSNEVFVNDDGEFVNKRSGGNTVRFLSVNPDSTPTTPTRSSSMILSSSTLSGSVVKQASFVFNPELDELKVNATNIELSGKTVVSSLYLGDGNGASVNDRLAALELQHSGAPSVSVTCCEPGNNVGNVGESGSITFTANGVCSGTCTYSWSGSVSGPGKTNSLAFTFVLGATEYPVSVTVTDSATGKTSSVNYSAYVTGKGALDF